MHRSFDITVPSEATDGLLEELEAMDHLVSLSVVRGASIKPRGDAVSVKVLNWGAPRVLDAVERAGHAGPVSVATSQLSSLIDPEHAEAVAEDIDESVWEEAETGLRHHSQLTTNFMLLMAAGGTIAACGLLSTGTAQAVALVSASVIAPAFEPVAKLPLALVLRRGQLVRHALRSLVAGYLALALAALAVALILDATGTISERTFVGNSFVHHLGHPPTVELVVSAAGAVAGIVMIAAERLTLLAGPLIALALVPALAMIPMAAVLGDGELVARGAGRLAIDLALIGVAGVLLFGWKQRRFHRRRPLV